MFHKSTLIKKTESIDFNIRKKTLEPRPMVLVGNLRSEKTHDCD